LIGGTVFLVILCLQRFAKGMVKISAILIGIVVGYMVAIILGQVTPQGPCLPRYLIPCPIPPLAKTPELWL
jgi:NCS2 family nucleobase:cation symporter-2